MLRSKIILAIILVCFACGCSGGSSGSTVVSANDLDGTTDVGVDSSFRYTFDQAVDTGTVSTSTYFLVQGGSSASVASKTEFDESVCNAASAVSAGVSCGSSTQCTLDPTENLSYGTTYSLCLLADIHYADASSLLIRNAYAGDAITPVQITFTTESNGDAATVSSLKDGDGDAIEATGTTGVNPTTFSMTFSGAMDDTSLISGGGLTFTCTLPDGSSMSQPTIAVAASESEDNTYTVTVEDAYEYQLMDCTLTATTSAKNSAGTALTSDIAYAFTSGCAVSDDFNADSQECWTAGLVPDTSYPTWSELVPNILSFDVGASTINFSDSTIAGVADALIGKSVSFSSSSLSINLHYSNVEGVDEGDESDYDDASIILVDPTFEAVYFNLGFSYDSSQTRLECIFDFETESIEVETEIECPNGTGYYLSFNSSASGTTVQYSTDGASYTDIPLRDGSDPLPTFDQISSALGSGGYMLMAWDTYGGQDMRVNLDSVAIEGITVEDQY